MKNFILGLGIIIGLTVAHMLVGQTHEGAILYEVKMNLHRNLPADQPQMKEMIPEYNSHKDRLVYKGGESLYKAVEDDEDDDFEGDNGMRIRMRRPMIVYYFNKDASKRIVHQEFFGKQYLIEDTIKILPWKLSDETKTINGIPCKRASYYNEERKQNITAWYADSMKPFLGPENFNTLPGTVLQVDINDGERIITAIKFENAPIGKNDLKVPTQGQRTTEKEFRKMVEEQLQKRGGGNVMIRN